MQRWHHSEKVMESIWKMGWIILPFLASWQSAPGTECPDFSDLSPSHPASEPKDKTCYDCKSPIKITDHCSK